MPKLVAITSTGFNSQPREGGWLLANLSCGHLITFQLTAARRRLVFPHR